MNARAVAAAAGVIHAAMRTHRTAAGIAAAVDAAGMLMSPEMAALLEHVRQASRSKALPADRLAEIRARAEAATAGPWCTDDWEIYQGERYEAGAEWIGETCRAVGQSQEDRANAAFVAAARSDVPALLAEVERLRAELADAANLRDHWHGDARASHAHIKTLQADLTADVPGLRVRIKELLERARTAEAERADLQVQLAEAQALVDTAPRTTWWLADYEGAEDGPVLFATLDAAKAWVADWSVGDPYWDWAEQAGTWVQVVCDPDTDRPLGRGSGSVKSAPGPVDHRVAELERQAAQPRELWLAEYETDTPRLYPTLAAARLALGDRRNADDPLMTWTWSEMAGVHSQWRTDPDTGQRLELLLGSVMRVIPAVSAEAGEPR